MTAPVLEVTEAPAPADVETLLRGLVAFNEPFLGRPDFRQLAVLARREGDLVGGLIGETGRGFLFVDLFWLDAGWRRQGLGSRLLAAAEAEAVARGCHSAWLDTYDFQARPFYERHGFELFGELTGFPNGHRRYFLVKRLAGAAGSGG
ncbi:GNAT family N-acetyltransferase [Benzoatithermus flavus]|uniref:GNAT family N-acetyltransferase n=1 Tax=Benzoatithermus flavus TaxID=3108223 RepID=A0ABU8XXH1_9PROT